MGFFNLLKKDESLIAVDIGSSVVKVLEFDLEGDKPRLVNVGIADLDSDVFANNVIVKPEKVADVLARLLESHAISDKRVVTAVPGPSVFTKKIRSPKAEPNELFENLGFEAANFVPHNIDAVKLDFHIIGEADKQNLDVLVVAVKNEIIDSFLECLGMAGLETAVVDVDYFALQNMFETCYPELIEKTVALINMGARYSSINICCGGQSLFTGDIGVGGRSLTEDLSNTLQVSIEEAEKIKRNISGSVPHKDAAQEMIDKCVEFVASEFNRQLSFFWNASGADEGIDRIMLSGGNSLLPGLVGELSERTGIECELLNPLKEIEIGEGLEAKYLSEVTPFISILVGLGIRLPGDREIPEY